MQPSVEEILWDEVFSVCWDGDGGAWLVRKSCEATGRTLMDGEAGQEWSEPSDGHKMTGGGGGPGSDSDAG